MDKQIDRHYRLKVFDDGTGELSSYDCTWPIEYFLELSKREVSLVELCLESKGHILKHYITQIGRWVSAWQLKGAR